MIERKPRKWTEEKIISELKNVIEQLGHFPKAEELRATGRSGLLCVLRKKGTYYYQKLLGFDGRKPELYWIGKTDELEKEIKSVIDEIGEFPTSDFLREINRTDILTGIRQNGLTFNYYREKFGFKRIERDKNYWKNWDNLVNELKPLIKDNVFPHETEIRKILGGGCTRSIRYFGGGAEVCKKLGCTRSYFSTARDGHYLRSYNELVFDEFLFSKSIQHEVDGLISATHNYRYDFKIGDIYFEIWGIDQNHSGTINQQYRIKREKKEKLYKELGLKLISIELEVFKKSFEEMEKYFCELMSNLGFDISQNKCDYGLEVINHRKKWDENKIIEELKEVISQIGRFPRQKDLKVDLSGAIANYGGFNYFAPKMGYKCKLQKYWNDEKIIGELYKIGKEMGYFPTNKEIKLLNNSLYHAITRHGGMTKYRKMMDAKSKRQLTKEKEFEIIGRICSLPKKQQFGIWEFETGKGRDTFVRRIEEYRKRD